MDRFDTHRVISTQEVAVLLDWPTWRARRWLKTTGASVKRGGRIVTTLGKLLEHFPEVGLASLAKAEERLGWANELAKAERRLASAEARIRALEQAVRIMRRERRTVAERHRRVRNLQAHEPKGNSH